VGNQINSLDGGGPSVVGAGGVSQRSQSAGTPSSSSAPPGSIHITDAASQLAQLEQAAQALPAVNEARVAAVASSIEQGTYTISASHIADQLLQLERSFGNA